MTTSSFSTVWLARDIKKKRDVALKIMVSGDQGDYECSMQKKIMSAVQEETSNLVTYLTAFSIPGCKGTNNYQVLVFPVLGPNFRSVMLNQISMTKTPKLCTIVSWLRLTFFSD